MHSRLVLFDIDGTLLDLRGLGLRALQRAATELHGEGCPELDLRGATDSGLVRKILGAYGVEVTAEATERFFDAYLAALGESIADEAFEGMLLPGVPELLAHLREAGATLGLLTGNIEAGARIKVEHFGLGDYFCFGAFGDDHHDRDRLGPVALRRAKEIHGRAFVGEETVVVGDTPRDVSCGKVLGARTVGVATGGYRAEELRACGADVVLDDLGDLEAVLAVLWRDSGNGH